MDYFFILLLIVLAFLLFFGGLFFSYLLAPHKTGNIKNSTYECGEKTIGFSWIHFNVGYYLFALMFLVFDVEAVFLFPWAVVIRDFGLVGLFEIGVFVSVLLLGLAYAWRKGVLKWV